MEEGGKTYTTVYSTSSPSVARDRNSGGRQSRWLTPAKIQVVIFDLGHPIFQPGDYAALQQGQKKGEVHLQVGVVP